MHVDWRIQQQLNNCKKSRNVLLKNTAVLTTLINLRVLANFYWGFPLWGQSLRKWLNNSFLCAWLARPLSRPSSETCFCLEIHSNGPAHLRQSLSLIICLLHLPFLLQVGVIICPLLQLICRIFTYFFIRYQRTILESLAC